MLKEIIISRIILDEKRQDQFLVLKEKDGDRQFPMIIGIAEVSSIKMELSNITPPRPIGHDLIVSLINKLGVEMKRVIIDKVVKNTFYARIELKDKEGNKIELDSRPSDAIAVALRLKVKIFAREKVIEKTELI